MKIENISKLTVTAFLALQLLKIDAGHAETLQNVVFKNERINNALYLDDPYFKISSVDVKALSDEESLEFNEKETQISDKLINNLANKANSNLKLNLTLPGPMIPSPVGIVPGGGGPVPLPPIDGGLSATGQFENVLMIIDRLIAVGQKITAIIKEGKAIVNNNPMAAISVLPRKEGRDPVVHDMGGWTIPVSKRYKISFKNLYGTEVVSFVYSVSFQYNGSTSNKGKYLAGVRASAREIDVLWGFDVDATSQLVQISNIGTEENVVAGATIELTYTVKSWAKSMTKSASFHVTGDGRFYRLD
jgi:hypothetical protein